MYIGILFWVIMVVGFLFGCYSHRSTPIVWIGDSFVLWVLLALLGWQVFGPVVHR